MRGDFVQEQFTRGNYPTESSHRRSYIPTGTSHQGNYVSQRCHTKKRNHIPCGHTKVIMSHRGSARGAMFRRGHTKRTIPRRCIIDTGNYIPRRSRRGNYPTQTSHRDIRQNELYSTAKFTQRELPPRDFTQREVHSTVGPQLLVSSSVFSRRRLKLCFLEQYHQHRLLGNKELTATSA